MPNAVDPKTLEKTVAELRRRIDADREYIAKDETRTRIVLIDPLLRALGWDVEKPSQVQLEYETSSGKPDYALMKSGLPVAVVEAKKLGTKLDTQNPQQVIKYGNDPDLSSREVVAFTNGDDWTFFMASRNWASVTAKISSDQTFKTAYDIVECMSPANLEVATPQPPSKAKTPQKRRSRNVAGAALTGTWRPLVGDLPNELPKAIRFGDAEPQKWVSWKALYTDVARRLAETGRIRESDLPFKVAKSNYCAINVEPVHPDLDRKPFGNPIQIGDHMWLESYGNKYAMHKYSGRLLLRFHKSPESVQLLFD